MADRKLSLFGIPLRARDRVNNTLEVWLSCVDDFDRDAWIDHVTYAVERAQKFPALPIFKALTRRLFND